MRKSIVVARVGVVRLRSTVLWGSCSCIGVLIVDRCEGQRLQGRFRAVAARDFRAHPDDVGGFTGRFYDNVTALANSKGYDGGFVWIDGDEVISNHCHGVSVDTELLNCLNTGIDETESMFLATRESELGQAGIVHTRRVGVVLRGRLAIKVHLTIDEVIVRGWAEFAEISALNVLQNTEIVTMVVVVQRDWAKIDIVIIVLGPVYNKRAPETTSVLAGVMRVIPCSPERGSFEAVGVARARCDGTHGNSGDTVHPSGVLLINAVPMHGGAFFRILNVIMDSNLDSVTPIGFDERLPEDIWLMKEYA